MIVNNYTGDNLNFGSAIETAKNVYKYQNIKAITIDDDCAIEKPNESTGRRGLTAINLIIKIAGAMAAAGYSIDEIHKRCMSLLSKIRTIGFSFHHRSSGELNNIEIGYGIHGERGIIKLDHALNFKPIIEVMLGKLKINEELRSDVILLFNNLGGASEFIFYEFIKEFFDAIVELPVKVIRVYVGRFLTSLGKEGIGVSVMEVRDEQLIKFLDYPVDVPAKEMFVPLEICVDPRVKNFDIPSHLHETLPMTTVKECGVSAELAKKIVTKICKKCIEAKECLNEMDGELADGDCGTTISRGAENILQALPALKFGNPHTLLTMLSDILMKSMGGTSGAIFSIFFQRASNAFAACNEYSIENWKHALQLGIKGIMEYGKAEIGDRTLLDALNSGYEAMKRIKEDSFIEAATAFANGCEEGCKSTQKMKAKSGRSSYFFSDSQSDIKFSSKYADAGAYAVALISREILDCFHDGENHQ